MIVDAHTDVLLELVVRDGEEPSLELVLRQGEAGVFKRYWLPRLVAGGVGVQICPLYGEGARRSDARERTLAQEAEFRRVVEDNSERVCQVHTSADLHDLRLRLVLSMEGVEPLDRDPDAFEEWYGRGVRTASLTWNHANEFAGGIDTPTLGLTDRGRALVRRPQRGRSDRASVRVSGRQDRRPTRSPSSRVRHRVLRAPRVASRRDSADGHGGSRRS
jgi:microsomal dipeptidase-like Zn-dependent dipeptidase